MEIEPQVLQLREAFQAAWKSGSRPNIAELISDLEGAVRTDALRELVTLDVEYRRRLGESPRASDYVAQFPESRDLIESLFSETQSLVGQSPPETQLRPAGRPVKPDSSIEATSTSIGAKEDRNQRTPTASASPTEDRSRVVPLAEFTRALTDSGLMDQGELDTFISSLPADHRPENGKQLAQELHRCKKLTRFQVQAVYQGKTRGLVVGNYVVLDKLGEGGMGQVYKARHKRMDRVVALKVLPAAATKSPESVKRFQREVKAAAKLTHPNIVTAYDANEHRGVYFLVMEYVEGKDLAGFVRAKGPLTVNQALDCIVQAAKGLAYAHKQGIVHRDIKPHNLLLDKSGTVKILDMGLARLEEQVAKSQVDDDGLTRSGAVMGTLDYMSPEQAINTKIADARADIYSLGCTLHFLLTGKPPYSGDSLAAKIVAHRVQPVPSLRAERKDVPEALDVVFQKMLAKTAAERQASMEALLLELERSRKSSDAGDMLEFSSISPVFEEVLELTDTDTTPLADPAASSVNMTGRWATPSIGSSPDSRTWPQKHKTLLICLGLLIPATLILALGLMITLRTTAGDLIVEVNESGASVEVLDSQGKVVVTGVSGQGPLTFSVEPGQHRIRVEKDGFVAHTSQIEIESRGKRSVSARLERKPPEQGTLVLKGTEAGALVEVLAPNGKIEAKHRTSGPELSVPMDSGTHRIRVEKDGAELLAQDVSVAARATVGLDVSTAFQARKQAVSAQPVAKLEPDPKPTPLADTTADPDRTIGALLIGLGGKLTISVYGAEREITSVEQFPKTPFTVVSLDLSDKPGINDDVIKNIVTLRGLRTMFLRGANLTDAGLEHVKNAKSLTTLDIAGTKVTAAGVSKFQSALPTCKTAVWKETAYVGADGNWKLAAGIPQPAIAPFDAAKAKDHQSAWAKYLGVPVEVTNSIGMKFVLIPPGEFDMGSTEADVAKLLAEAKANNAGRWYIDRLPAEAPKHRVRITTPFWLGVHEVTRGQFRRFVEDRSYKTEAERDGRGGIGLIDGQWKRDPRFVWNQDVGVAQADDHPVMCVSWNDVTAFCGWLSRKESEKVQLPSEAQWEYACRAGRATTWYSSDDVESPKEYAWFDVNSEEKTHAVGQKWPNAWGLYDMHGNVWEWCQDWYDKDYYQGSPTDDPPGPPTAAIRVFRGGGWFLGARRCRAANRGWDTPSHRSNDVGFRVALVAPGK